MLDKIPSDKDMIDLIGKSRYDTWLSLVHVIDSKYDMDRSWDKGGKRWTYEYKYRRGGKTLCTLYAKENTIGFMIIFGADERAKVESMRPLLSDTVKREYDEAFTYHDGKWVMFTPDEAFFMII